VYVGGMVGAWLLLSQTIFIRVPALTPPLRGRRHGCRIRWHCTGSNRTLIMVAETTGGYGLIVPSMLATTIAFVVERTISTGFKYPRLYEARSS